MAGPDRPHPASVVDAIKNVFDMTPKGAGGIGPTLGQDVSVEAQRQADLRSKAKPAPSADGDDGGGVSGAVNTGGGE